MLSWSKIDCYESSGQLQAGFLASHMVQYNGVVLFAKQDKMLGTFDNKSKWLGIGQLEMGNN